MDTSFKLKLDNPLQKANIVSKLFFCWMVKLCTKCTKKGLEIEDLYKTLPSDQSELLTNKLEKHWEDEIARSEFQKPSLLRAIIKTFIWHYMLWGLLLFFFVIILSPSQPVVLAYFISLFSKLDSNDNRNEKYIGGSILVIQSLLTAFSYHHNDFGQCVLGMRIRIAVSSLVYRKILRLDKTSLGQTAAGHAINLLSNDVQRFDLIMSTLHYLWVMPLQVCVITYLIWQQVGISSLAGVITLIILIVPGQAYLIKLTSKWRLQVAEGTDSRVKILNEIIAGIQVIKMYAWEKPFEKIVEHARRREINALTKASYLRAIYLSAAMFTARLTVSLTVICYVLLGNFLKPEQVFSLAQFFSLLELTAPYYYLLALNDGAETLISIKRLQEFLLMNEKPATTIKKLQQQKGVVLKNITTCWTPSREILKQINLEIPEGKLCVVTGPVGAGKSTLLQLLLGELPTMTGTISIGGQISYASQEPWLFAATVRENVLFGLNYDENHYDTIVRVCALQPDFEQFPQGDRTIVGERGISLSGGQRARINLARAVYRNADIYLLDDPLSAVDNRVGRHLFDECIFKYLKGKTRILVTHQLQYLQKADYIIVINKGQIEAQGTFEEISTNNSNFSKLLTTQGESNEREEEAPDKSLVSQKASLRSSSGNNVETNAEEMASKDSKPFKDYVCAAGNYYSIFGLCIVLVLGSAACCVDDYWLSLWTQQESLRHQSLHETKTGLEFESNHSTHHWYDGFIDEIYVNSQFHYLIKTNVTIYIYTSLTVAAIVFTFTKPFVFFKMAMTASKNLHNQMFRSLLVAPMRFFNKNHPGRILNRFSKDMGTIDEVLPRVLLMAIHMVLSMSGILTIIIITNYYTAIGIAIFGYIFFKVRRWYIMTVKDVKYLEGITKSPVFSHISSSFYGMTTIRASQAEKMLMKQFDQHQDVHTAAWFLTISTRVCISLWLEMISILFLLIVIFSFIISSLYSNVSASFVGLAIYQSLILTMWLQYGLRLSTEVANQLTNVERIIQYTKLEDERKSTKIIKYAKLDDNCSNEGGIIFKNLSLRYSELDEPVLKYLNIEITPGTKVGIVGRTGAGKSSLLSALFRLAPIEGTIYIDGVDTQTISLDILRRKISIIPQESVLFSGTLRHNLDPFHEFDDQALWNAIEEVELKDALDHLDHVITEGGSKFSVGQRQLICLARAILRNNKILMLDEATANIDSGTDALIQKTIRRKFKHCTVLTIAHRLHTVMDSDKILVMDAGRVIEYDHPHILLQNTDGHFYKMVLKAGPKMAEQLKRISRDVYSGNIEEI